MRKVGRNMARDIVEDVMQETKTELEALGAAP